MATKKIVEKVEEEKKSVAAKKAKTETVKKTRKIADMPAKPVKCQPKKTATTAKAETAKAATKASSKKTSKVTAREYIQAEVTKELAKDKKAKAKTASAKPKKSAKAVDTSLDSLIKVPKGTRKATKTGARTVCMRVNISTDAAESLENYARMHKITKGELMHDILFDADPKDTYTYSVTIHDPPVVEKTTRTTIRCTPAEYKKITAFADKQGMHVSAAALFILKDWLHTTFLD